jgi:hypothetical protein
MKSKSVICAQVMIEMVGPADPSSKRIRFVVGILRSAKISVRAASRK